MDFLTYIQKLQNELSAHNIPKDQIHIIITQESALAEVKETAELEDFFSLNRLETLLVRATQQNKSSVQIDETKTIAPQGTFQNGASNVYDEEKTILQTSPKATLHSLTDEATMVVISHNLQDATLEKTIAASPDLKRLLSENETVKISEKDTVFFKNDLNSTSVSAPEEETVQHTPFSPKRLSSPDTDATAPIYNRPPVAKETITEQTRVIPSQVFQENANQEKTPSEEPTKKEQPSSKVQKNDSLSSALPLSPDALRNPHPNVSFWWLALLLVPSICFLAVLLVAFIVIANLLFLIAFTSVMLLYFVFLFVPLFFALYSAVFALLYWQDFRIADGLTEFGIMLFSSGLSLMFGYLMYRTFIVTSERIGEKCKAFNQKTFRLVRNLYRYSVKGAEKL